MSKGDFFVKISKKEYQALAAQMAPKSPLVKDMVLAFLIGGAICTLGQLVQNGWKAAGLNAERAGTATAISMVFLSSVLTALSVYDDIAKHAGAGTLVPITGFANAVVSPAMDFRAEGLVTGMAAKMFVIAGPVIVYGITASVIYGVIEWLLTSVL